MELIAALDIGGTKLAAGLVDFRGRLRNRAQRPTRGNAPAEDLLADTCDLLAEVIGSTPRLAGIAVGCGGPMSEHGVSPVNIPAWRDFPLREHLEERFENGLRGPVVVDNDAKMMAMGEGWLGAARDADNYLGMVVSTGVGGGIVLNGRILDGRLGNAGHIGHLIVVPGGATCGCGHSGCLEAEASGTAIARDAASLCEDGSAGATLRKHWEASGGSVTAVQVAEAARSGDESAAALLGRAGRLVGKAIADVATLLDLRLAVVGGGVAQVGEIIFEPMRAEAAATARLLYTAGIEIRAAALSTDAGLVGAAADWLWRTRGERPEVVP